MSVTSAVVRFLRIAADMPSRSANVLGSSAALLGIPSAMLLRSWRGRQVAERLAAAALETLLNAIDINDPSTGAHVRRVTRYALILSDNAGFDAAMHRAVERVALFHDIGKIHGALFDILHDPAALTASERRTIRLHPAHGAAVLGPIASFYPDLAKGVLSHHERWDGRGYPRQLKGRRIPLTARVVSIADVFDAITQRRAYRGARSSREAAAVIQNGRGTQFDPELVDLFLFPPVLEEISLAMEAANQPARATRNRRRGKHGDVSDIEFRWRTASIAAPTKRRAAAGTR